MMVKLLKEWRDVLRKAWSVRLMGLAGLLTGAEAIVDAIGSDWMPIPKWSRMLVILAVTGGAFVTRLLAQKSMSDGN